MGRDSDSPCLPGRLVCPPDTPTTKRLNIVYPLRGTDLQMAHRTVVASLLLALISVSCGNPTAARPSASAASPVAPPTAVPAIAPKAEIEEPGGLPRPETKVSFQAIPTRAIPVGNGQFAHQVVDQWLFGSSASGESLICVGDDSHCITLAKLREQLNRPANDPLGIR